MVFSIVTVSCIPRTRGVFTFVGMNFHAVHNARMPFITIIIKKKRIRIFMNIIHGPGVGFSIIFTPVHLYHYIAVVTSNSGDLICGFYEYTDNRKHVEEFPITDVAHS